jgi:hypothetical protein
MGSACTGGTSFSRKLLVSHGVSIRFLEIYNCTKGFISHRRDCAHVPSFDKKFEQLGS